MYLIRGCVQTTNEVAAMENSDCGMFAANCLLHRLQTNIVWILTVAIDASCQHHTRRHINSSVCVCVCVCVAPAHLSFTKELQVTYRSLNAIVAQPKNCPFGVNTTIELKNN
jgi:hypothetical protein